MTNATGRFMSRMASRWSVGLLVAALLFGSACSSDEAQAPGTDSPTAEVVTTDAAASAERGLPPSSDGLVLASLQRTAETEAYRFAARVSMDFLPGTAPAPILVDGAVDSSGRVSMSMDMSAMFEAIAGELPASEAAEVQALVADPLEMIVDGDNTVYMRWPAFIGAIGVPTEWVSVSGGPLMTGGVPAGSVMGPDEFFPALQAAGNFERVGQETVRGVETERWDGDVDWIELARTQLESQFAGDPAMQAELEAFLDEGVPGLDRTQVSVWIDGEGMLRRFHFAMEIPDVATGGDGAAMDMTYEMFDFGAPVVVDVPDPADVTDVTALAGITAY